MSKKNMILCFSSLSTKLILRRFKLGRFRNLEIFSYHPCCQHPPIRPLLAKINIKGRFIWLVFIMKLHFKTILRFEQISSTVTKMSLRQKCGCLRSSGSSDLGFCDMSVELRCLDLTGSNVQGLNVEVDSIFNTKTFQTPLLECYHGL